MSSIKIWNSESVEKEEVVSLSFSKDSMTESYLQSYLLRLTNDNKILVLALDTDLIIWNLKEKDVSRKFKSLHTKGKLNYLMIFDWSYNFMNKG